MVQIGAGIYTGGQEYGLTGIKRPPNYGDIIGTQASYLPQLYAAKKAETAQDKAFKLQEESLTKEIQLARDRMAQIESLGGQELASNEALSRERMELDRALSGYETSMNSLLANQRLEQEKKQAQMANLIGMGQTAVTGALGYSALKEAGVFGGGGAAGVSLGGAGAGFAGGGTLAGAIPVAGTLAGDTALASTAPALGGGTTGFTVGETMGSSARATVGFGSYLGAAGAGYGVGSMTSKALGGGPKGTFGGALSGAAAGALYGTYIMPGIGTGIGAAIGAITGAFGGSGKCCFIFIASHGYLHPIVREYRDMKMTTRNRRGYYWLADRLVPLMEKSKIATWAVKWLMVKPMTCYGKYYYNLGRYGALYAPITALWRGIFNALGRRPPYQRRGTQEVV